MTGKLAPLLLGAAALTFSLTPQAKAGHRDAPTIGNYSAVDINDLYMFRDPPCTTTSCSSPKLVIALSTQALADPLFGPSYHFQENALYRLSFTTKSDARVTANIDFVFSPFGNGPACPAPATPCQTYTATFPGNNVVVGLVTEGTDNATHLQPVVTTAGAVKVFAGPREDPFFFDLVGFNRTINSSPAQISFTGVDAFKGKNINAIVVELPLTMVFPAGACIGSTTPVFSTPCGAWATTFLGNFNYDDPNEFEPLPEGLRQVDRMGNPAVNTLLIPPALKDAFNFGKPKDDTGNFGGVIANQIAALDAKFCPLHATDCRNPNPNNPLLLGIMVPDVLRFAQSLPDGYPNGRQLADRTTDILLSLILEVPGFTDGTAVKIYCPEFPFLGPPLQLSGMTPFGIIPQACP